MLAQCGFRHPPERRGRPQRRSGKGSRGSRIGVRWAGRHASRSAGSIPLCAPDSGSGQRSISRAYSAAPIPQMSSSGVADGSVAGKASTTSPSMLTRTRPGWSMDSATPARCAASAAAASDWMARAPPIGAGEVAATSAREPPRTHSLTTRPPWPMRVTSRMRARPGAEILLNFKVRARIRGLRVGQRRSGVDEGQGHLSVQRGVQCVPELQMRRASMEDQQPVAAVGECTGRRRRSAPVCSVSGGSSGGCGRCEFVGQTDGGSWWWLRAPGWGPHRSVRMRRIACGSVGHHTSFPQPDGDTVCRDRPTRSVEFYGVEKGTTGNQIT